MSLVGKLLTPRAVQALFGLLLASAGISLIFMGLWWARGVEIASLEADVSRARDTILAQSEDVQSVLTANREFEAQAEAAGRAVDAARQAEMQARARAAQIAAGARAREQAAIEALRRFRSARVAAAADAECARLLATPVCPSLQVP